MGRTRSLDKVHIKIYSVLNKNKKGECKMIEQKISYTKNMAEYDRKLEIAKKVALTLSEARARVEDLSDIFSLARKQLYVSILPDSEQSQRFSDKL